MKKQVILMLLMLSGIQIHSMWWDSIPGARWVAKKTGFVEPEGEPVDAALQANKEQQENEVAAKKQESLMAGKPKGNQLAFTQSAFYPRAGGNVVGLERGMTIATQGSAPSSEQQGQGANVVQELQSNVSLIKGLKEQVDHLEQNVPQEKVQESSRALIPVKQPEPQELVMNPELKRQMLQLHPDKTFGLPVAERERREAMLKSITGGSPSVERSLAIMDKPEGQAVSTERLAQVKEQSAQLQERLKQQRAEQVARGQKAREIHDQIAQEVLRLHEGVKRQELVRAQQAERQGITKQFAKAVSAASEAQQAKEAEAGTGQDTDKGITSSPSLQSFQGLSSSPTLVGSKSQETVADMQDSVEQQSAQQIGDDRPTESLTLKDAQDKLEKASKDKEVDLRKAYKELRKQLDQKGGQDKAEGLKKLDEKYKELRTLGDAIVDPFKDLVDWFKQSYGGKLLYGTWIGKWLDKEHYEAIKAEPQWRETKKK